MIQNIFNNLESFNDFVWSYIIFFLLFSLGIYLSIISRFFQIRQFPQILKIFFSFFKNQNQDRAGVHPLKAFFAAIGGCIGIGNIVGICTAVQLGGPGALFWTWISALFGMLIQYSEVYLGMKYRVSNQRGSFDGGPMFFLPKAYGFQWIAYLACFFLCMYGTEFFAFNVVSRSISDNWNIPLFYVVPILLMAVIFVAAGGINRVGSVCSAIIPMFIILYVGMGLWVIGKNLALIPSVLSAIIQGAFTSQGAIGGFAGSTVALTMSMGLSRGAYSGDIGIGYTSIVHSESRAHHFGRQSALAIVGIFIDTFVICTMSVLMVLMTGHWKTGMSATVMVQESLGAYFPYMHLFMPFFLFLLGYSTLVSYFVVGTKSASFISKKWGTKFYYIYSCLTLPLLAFVDSSQAFVLMSIAGSALLFLNVIGIYILRREIKFELGEQEALKNLSQ
jgi:AGCS family alanine or glycine:cation symporter